MTQRHGVQPRQAGAPAPLRHAIQCFWHVRWQSAAPLDVIPDGYAEIIFHAGAGIADPSGRRLPSPFVMGLLDQPVRMQVCGPVDILGVRCFPWAVHELLQVPSVLDEIRLLDHPFARLQAPLASCLDDGRVEEAFDVLARYFLDAPPAVDRLLSQAGGALRAAHGTLPVSQVAASAHATVRTLERRFKQASGRTVKDVSNLIRFEQVRNRLWTDPDANLAALAREAGYADQSHLSREFKRYAGMTPAVFAQARKKWTRPEDG